MIFFENKKDLKSEQDNTDSPPHCQVIFYQFKTSISHTKKTPQAQSLKCLSLFYENISFFPCSSTHLLDKGDDFFLIQRINYQRNQFFW